MDILPMYVCTCMHAIQHFIDKLHLIILRDSNHQYSNRNIIHQNVICIIIFSFAVIVSFAQPEYEVKESTGTATLSGILITVNAQGDLPSAGFIISLNVTGGTASGMWGCAIFCSVRIL